MKPWAPESDSWNQIKWLRPSEIAEFKNGDLAVFSGGIEPADIKQGMLGDCYFLSVLAALTETPSRIEKLFKMDMSMETSINKWKVCFTKNGIMQEIEMDSYIPCLNGSPCFARANGPELWVIILEKAWAKLHSSYVRIEAGVCANVMRDLTGAPSFIVDTAKEEDLPLKLVQYDEANYVMSASCNEDDEAAKA